MFCALLEMAKCMNLWEISKTSTLLAITLLTLGAGVAQAEVFNFTFASGDGSEAISGTITTGAASGAGYAVTAITDKTRAATLTPVSLA